MTNLIKHKRVEFSELFYDLVFVFAPFLNHDIGNT